MVPAKLLASANVRYHRAMFVRENNLDLIVS